MDKFNFSKIALFLSLAIIPNTSFASCPSATQVLDALRNAKDDIDVNFDRRVLIYNTDKGSLIGADAPQTLQEAPEELEKQSVMIEKGQQIYFIKVGFLSKGEYTNVCPYKGDGRVFYLGIPEE